MRRPLIALLTTQLAAFGSVAQRVEGEGRDSEGNSSALFLSETRAAQVNLFDLSSTSNTSARDGKTASGAAQRLCSEGGVYSCAATVPVAIGSGRRVLAVPREIRCGVERPWPAK